MGYTSITLQRPLHVESLISVHYFEYGSNYYFEGERHNFWEFLYVDKGEVDVRADDRDYHMTKGQIIFHRPGEFHSLAANGRVAPNLVVVSFVCDGEAMRFFEGRIMSVGDDERALMACVVEEARAAFSSPMGDPLTMKLTRADSAPFGAEQLIGAALESLLVRLCRRGGEPSPPCPTSRIRERAQQELFDRVHRYFEDNISRRLTLADVCRDNLVGRSYLQKVFRERTGGGVMEYFGGLKIEAAKRMIREGGHNFTEIAALLEYSSIHYFSRHFKSAAGMTPSEYASSVKMLSSKTRVE